MTHTVEVTLPKGTVIFEGVAGPQFQWSKLLFLRGGGAQIFVPFKDLATLKGLDDWADFTPALQF